MQMARHAPVALTFGILLLSLPVAALGQLGGEIVPGRPGGTRPVRLSKSRISPLPEAQWTDAHKELVAKYVPDGRPGNAFRTLLNIPALLNSIVPFQNYITRDSSLSRAIARC